jgi:hypothetical protein
MTSNKIFMNILVMWIIWLITLASIAEANTSVSPTWTPNPYFEAKTAAIKSDITWSFGSGNPQTVPVTFTKTYTVIPQLAFGIKNYRGTLFSNFRL